MFSTFSIILFQGRVELQKIRENEQNLSRLLSPCLCAYHERRSDVH